MLLRGELRGVRVGTQWRFPIESLTELIPSKTRGNIEGTPEVPPIRDTSIGKLVDAGGIHYRIAGNTRDEVLREAVSATSRIPSSMRSGLFHAILEREALCSTGIGNGVAVPHPKIPMPTPITGIPSLVALHFLEHPVDFGSVDKEPVSVLFLLLMKTPQEHLRALARLIRLLREDSFLATLHEAPLRSVVHAELSRLEGTLIPEGP